MNDATARPRVLVVDDESINIKALNEALRDQCEVLFATSGRKALAVAAATLPDLVLLDIKMPEMDGYAVCRAMKDDDLLRAVPVIFITALASEADESMGLELGAVDYIAKPFNPAVVRLRVKNHLEMKRQRDLLSRLSFMDSLTDLPNRRAFDERLDAEWRRAMRFQTPLSVLMIDIDHFKGYNDTHGHLAGDGCLRQVARALADSVCRVGDFLARYGGEEFICLLPGQDPVGVRALAEKLRATVVGLHIDHAASPVCPWVTISLGIASSQPPAGGTPERLVAAADERLYLAKKCGRNQAM